LILNSKERGAVGLEAFTGTKYIVVRRIGFELLKTIKNGRFHIGNSKNKSFYLKNLWLEIGKKSFKIAGIVFLRSQMV